MATTTNYSWTTPDDTALVKDGASAIRTLGSSVDTTLKNLNPSTTLGDIEYRSSSANVNTRLAIGSTGQVLTVSGGVPAWAAASQGAVVLTGSSTFSASNSVNIDNCFSSSYKNYLIMFEAVATNTGDQVYLRFRSGGSTNTTSNFYTQLLTPDGSSITASRNGSAAQEGRLAVIHTGGMNSYGVIQNPYDSKPTTCLVKHIFNNNSVPGMGEIWNTFNATTSFDGINVWVSVGTITGTVKIYGLVNS